MIDVLKKEIVVTMTVRDALRAYAVLGVTNGVADNLYYTLEAHLRSFGDTDEAERISCDKLKEGSYWSIQHEIEEVFLRGNKTETELQIDKLEESVKQLQAQIQELRTTVREG